jgi:hypothetical protein
VISIWSSRIGCDNLSMDVRTRLDGEPEGFASFGKCRATGFSSFSPIGRQDGIPTFGVGTLLCAHLGSSLHMPALYLMHAILAG